MDQIDIALRGSFQGFLKQVREHAPDWAPDGLLQRFAPFPMGWQCLKALGVDNFSKQYEGVAGLRIKAYSMDGRFLSEGVNFGTQDALSLARHPAVLQSVHEALLQHGLHAGASSALLGNSRPVHELSQALGQYLGRVQCEVFQGGWGACYGAVRALVGPQDHAVFDALAHNSLVEGGRASGASIHHFAHLDVQALANKLIELRAEFPRAGILVVTESVFSMDGDAPDLRQHLDVCRAHRATLLVDVSHDFGAFGPRGLGELGAQGVLDEVDFIVGSLSKAFASNGGFVATHEPGFELALRYAGTSSTFAAQLSPLQAAAALKALSIIDSPEGDALRGRLQSNCQTARTRLRASGWQVLGDAGALVPVVLGGMGRSRLIQRSLLQKGVVTNLVEYPAVPRNASRLRLQFMADHTPEHIDFLVRTLGEAAQEADAALADINQTRPAEQQIS